jgi:hypothetical protein
MLTERNSWDAVKLWNAQQIERWRVQLEDFNVTPDRANQLRGMIEALRQQQSHVEPPKSDPPKEPGYGY